MGYYTEVYINVDLKPNTPDSVLCVLKAMCGLVDDKEAAELLKDYPPNWRYLFYNGSYYTPNTSCRLLTQDPTYKYWSLLGKGDIKNYGREIEQFFDWIDLYVDNGYGGRFIGYIRGEDSDSPSLVFKKEQE